MPPVHAIHRVLSPVLYSGAVGVVFLALGACVAWLERNVGLHTIWRTGDVEMVVVGVPLGGAAFAAATLVLTRLERLDRPRLQDHLRHSALLYALVGVEGPWLVATRAREGGGLMWALVASATMAAVLAGLVNAATLKVLSSRGSRRGEIAA